MIAFWSLVGVIYVWTGWQQKQRLNLSATAGGQMPYLVYAEGVAKDGLLAHFGDRNRMPLIPSLLSFLYEDDWDAFVYRASVFAIVSSKLVLIGIGILAYRHLPFWSATVLALIPTVCIFPYKASFVQAELAYYGLLFATWLMICRLLQRSSWPAAVVCGLVLGVTYLAKASAVGALVAFLVVGLCRIVILWYRSAKGSDAPDRRRREMWRVLRDTGIVVLVFLAVASPYLTANKARFGRFFYNVNSTFFMWCDSWAQAKSFADAHDLASHYPQAPPEQIPSLRNYWRTHSASQMGRRLAYGFSTLAGLALRGPYAKYLAAATGLCVVLALRQRKRLAQIIRRRAYVATFCVLFVVGYLFSYAWYAQVAYGDRFVLSLVLPVMFSLLWLGWRLGRDMQPIPLLGRRVPFADVLCLILIALLLLDGGAVMAGGAWQPTREFVQFYYNETREQQQAGNLVEAEKGYRGVIQLDPEFAPAYHDLGMMALISGRTDAAVDNLAKAAELAPDNADIFNSYGSALLQGGRPEEALSAFREAVRLNPTLAPAWYNLGGTCHMLGKEECAVNALARLRSLDSGMGEQLARLLD